ncbi:MAG: protein phosphatase 2C domain-containing protein [Caldilineaceae bacterium]|nr:protein phosphatase 2C domain-containing protein [Caldilineaceae bacterium]
MRTQHEPDQWYLLGYSQIGATHQRAGRPNQDAMSVADGSTATTAPPPLVVAVADGHGSARYARSDQGASIAVACAVQLLDEMLKSARETEASYSEVKRYAEERLPQLLVQRWRDEVESELKRHPPDDGDDETGILLYGTTLLAMALTESYMIFLQIGDGDFRMVTEEGHVYAPLQQDQRLLGTETFSLAQAKAWKYVRVHFQMWGDTLPALLMLSTDGYSNSFVSPEDFDRVGSDLLTLLRAEGVDAIQRKLPEWLKEASEAGSGDDVTVVLVYRESPRPGEKGMALADTSGEQSPTQTADVEPEFPIGISIPGPEAQESQTGSVETENDSAHEQGESR